MRIPLPPPDPLLSAMGMALDGSAMAEVLSRHLPECASGALQMVACRPVYIRHKPGKSCLVQYALTLRDPATSLTTEQLAHADLYGDRRVPSLETAWSGESLHRLVQAAARNRPSLPISRSALVPALRAIVQLFPVDVELPGLVVASSPDDLRLAAGAAQPAASAWWQPIGRAELLRYKPARKALLRYRPADGVQGSITYGKLHVDDRGPALVSATESLRAAGVNTPAALAYLPDLHLRVYAEAQGQRLADLGGTPEEMTWMEAVAAALAHLHTTRIVGLRASTVQEEAALLVKAGRSTGRLLPAHTSDIERLAAQIAAHLAQRAEAMTTVHHDFYDDQVLVSDAGVALIDFDDVRLGHPLLDVGNFLAHVSARQGGIAGTADLVRARFLEAYAALRPDARDHALLFEAVGLLRLAVGPFRRLERDWPVEVERLVGLTARRLAEYERQQRVALAVVAGAEPTGTVDPRLPQLQTLQHPTAMAEALRGSVYAEPIAVTSITVARYKPGRRCIFRYEVQVGPPETRRSERLYGKTFAGSRGPRVYAALRAISAARACGPDVWLPEPVAYLGPLKLLLQREVPGRPIGPALLRGDELLARRLADALHELHTSGVTLERRHSLGNEVDPLPSRVERLSEACPALAPAARRCLALVGRAARHPWPWRWRPIHRDFYYDQALVGEHGLAVLDFDDAAMSEPAIDVANFLGHLRLLSLQETSAPDSLAAVADAFTRRYQQLDPDLDPGLLRVLEGATLLRLADIHLPRSRGEWLATRLLDQSESLLRPLSVPGDAITGLPGVSEIRGRIPV